MKYASKIVSNSILYAETVAVSQLRDESVNDAIIKKVQEETKLILNPFLGFSN